MTKSLVQAITESDDDSLQNFTVTLGVSVRAYATVSVKAKSVCTAAEQLRKAAEVQGSESTLWDMVNKVEWDTRSEPTIVSLCSEDGLNTCLDIELFPSDAAYMVIDRAALRDLVDEAVS